MSITVTVSITADTMDDVKRGFGEAIDDVRGMEAPAATTAEAPKAPRGRPPKAVAPAAAAAAPAAPATPTPDLQKDVLPVLKAFAERHGVEKAQAMAVKHGAAKEDPRASQVPSKALGAYFADLQAGIAAPETPAPNGDLL